MKMKIANLVLVLFGIFQYVFAELKPCLGDPPQTRNGKPILTSREHGSYVFYKCDNPMDHKTSGPVVCINGTWRGKATKCYTFFCRTEELNLTGLVKPSEERIQSLRSVNIVCENGLRTSTSAKRITCFKERQSTNRNPCTEAEVSDDECQIPIINAGTVKKEVLAAETFNWRTFRYDIFDTYQTIPVGSRVLNNTNLWLYCSDPYSVQGKKERAEITCAKGKWSMDLVCVPAENCSSAGTTFAHNSITNFTCKEPYKLVGNREMKCAFGKWEGEFPKCIDYGCQIPIINAGAVKKEVLGAATFNWRTVRYDINNTYETIPVGNRVPNNTILWLYCSDPYSVQGKKERTEITCTEGNWSMDLVCVPAENCSNASRTFAHNSITNFVCKEPYKLVGNPKMKCAFGKWEGEFPKCKDSRCYFKALQYSDHVSLKTPSFILSGDKLNIVCDEGYSSITEKPICENGTWNQGNETLCNESECQIPHVTSGSLKREILTNYYNYARLQNERKFRFEMIPPGTTVPAGTDLWLYCNGSYTVHGRGRLRILTTCSKGKWTPDLICALVPIHTECPELENPRDMFKIRYDNNKKVNSSAFYLCKNDSHILNGTMIRKCLENGQWSSSSPSCTVPLPIDILCPELENPQEVFHIVYSSARKVNSTASYSCKHITQTINGTSERTCLKNREWSGSTPSCADITCPFLPTNSAVNTSYSNKNKVGSIAKFSCPIYANLVGANNSTCQQNGSWNSHVPQCHDITCPFFTSEGVVNTTFSNGNKVGSVAKFSCPSYANLVGANSSTCQQDGSWNSPLPQCDDFVFCPLLNSPDLNITYSKGVSVNSIALFSCSSTAILVGNTYAICQLNGTWSSPLPSCEDTFSGCALERNPFSHLQIQPEKYRYQFGEFVLLSCPPFQKLFPKVERMMCLGDTWSDVIPECKEKY